MIPMNEIADRVAKRIADLTEKKVEELLRSRYNHLNLFAQAFLESTGARPEDCELVEVREGNVTRWYFRRREGV